jgi:hypothetical protein
LIFSMAMRSENAARKPLVRINSNSVDKLQSLA